MKLACPSCGALMSLDVIVAHDGAREAVQIALQLPAPMGKLLIQYITLFRPEKRQLTLDRLASLLGELLPLIQSGQITRDGRVWAVPAEVWPAALQEILDRDRAKPFTRPLKSHGYLLEILVGKASKAEARSEALTEERRRNGGSGSAAKRQGMADVAGHLSNLKGALK
ncbi:MULTISPECIES: hypothetical protein [Methylococcus]|uniref:Uncharacterized protein n=1 Tax=Methylococcus capsulatus TaxID=414 RepID=A0ABZ2F7Z0_METCP|nr:MULTISPECIES: hypothetical protein [Methylococcus]MDF9393841.1 hypothetical protein [Methylococcus capsulatus]